MPGFPEFFVVLLHYQRQVRVPWLRASERPLQRDLPTRAGEQISAAHHLGHVLCPIVDHHGELVGDDFVLALDHEVAQLARFEPAGPLYSIVK